MTDLQARLVAAIQQVRASTLHVAPCYYAHDLNDLGAHVCTCSRAERVDARLAACGEAAIVATMRRADNENYLQTPVEAGLAAFLAAAAQEETTT